MALTKRERNMVIGIVAVVVIAVIAGAFFLGRSGSDDNATTTPTATQTTPTATQTTPTQTVVTVTVPAETPPADTSAALEITERIARPEVVPMGMPMEFTVKLKGNASSVVMSIRGPVDSTVSLNRIATVGEITTWAATSAAPGIPGVYRYYATATSAADGSTAEMPGVSGWSFQVTP